MNRPTQILVPTDFSSEANAAKVYATMLAEAFGAELHVLHVVPDPISLGWAVDSAYLPQLLERTERGVRDQMEQLFTPDEREKLSPRLVVETGSPITRILEYADRSGVDLIVMGTHGRGALERLWVGSVTQGVVQRARCPVVSVQQPRK